MTKGTNKQVLKLIGGTRDIKELRDVINPPTPDDRQGRYYKLNLRTDNRTTIEFRGHSGTHDISKIKRWVNLFISFVENSSKMERPPRSFLDRRDAEYKFHCLFEWVVRGNTMYRFFDERRRDFASAA